MRIDYHLNCKNHISQIIPKLGAEYYIVRHMYYICNNDALRSNYFAYFHSILSCGIIIWRNSSNSSWRSL
jgi:hypothetical protein